ncbi:MAG: LamG domain-containing protein [Candidatus Sumerlaeota bacterium]|nr:LamG domain-containing protein [Candidatus Sumerlaeota bacterium]
MTCMPALRWLKDFRSAAFIFNVCALGAFGILFCRGAMQAAPDEQLTAWWSFDQVVDHKTPERVARVDYLIGGAVTQTRGVVGAALKFDGFTTELKQEAASAPRLDSAFTLETWVALGAYPWNWCPIISQSRGQQAGYYFAVGPRGQLTMQMAVDDKWFVCTSKDFALPLRKWAHVAGAFQPDKGLAIYVNGQEAGSTATAKGAFTAAKDEALIIGVIPAPVKPSNIHREHGTLPAWFSLDGIVDELKIHKRALNAQEVAAAFAVVQPASEPDLPLRKMPSGPAGPGRFGAYYCALKYYPEWDALWRVGPDPDVLVRFDESPARVVFWRGTRYSPAWVSENELWMADQSVEAWQTGANDTEGCFEHMQDPHCIYSHVRIIENTDARVVVHWRYAPVSSHNHLWRVDPKTGFACWVDEYYTIYPDAAGIRKVTWQAGTLGNPRQFQESLAFTQPGQYCSDVVEKDFCDVANLKGERATLSFVEKPEKKKPGVPANLMMQIYNFKAKNDPFIIYEPGNRMEYVNDRNIRELSRPGACNHWPVGQLPCDGRTSQAPDHPTHFLGFPISYPPIHNDGVREWWNGIYGMTERGIEGLLPLARSWNAPPELKITGDGFVSEGYDRGQRAYLLARQGAIAETPLVFDLPASESGPVFNPAFVIKGWGDASATLRVGDKEIPRGKDFRFGHRRNMESTDLIVWLKLSSQQPVGLTLSPAP